MRTELESAMAAVITSPVAHHSFVDDPRAFAEGFHLAPAEVHLLLAMERDLASLTASFVAKRVMMVRWNAQRTLAMLGGGGDALIEEYIGTHLMIESLSEEAERFGDFVVDRTRAMVDETFRSVVIAEMARYERQRSLSFWGAKSTPQPRRRSRPIDGADGIGGGLQSGRGAIGLTPGARVDAFGWDMRIFHRCRVFPLRLLREDPCDLLFFHNGRSNGLRVHRLRPDELALVRRMQERSPLSEVATVAGRSGEVTAGEVAAPFLACGAMMWA